MNVLLLVYVIMYETMETTSHIRYLLHTYKNYAFTLGIKVPE